MNDKFVNQFVEFVEGLMVKEHIIVIYGGSNFFSFTQTEWRNILVFVKFYPISIHNNTERKK